MKKFKEEKTRLYIDDDHLEVYGTTPDLLVLYIQLTEKMYELENVEEDDIELAFKMARMSKDKLKEMAKEKLNNLLNKLKEALEDSE